MIQGAYVGNAVGPGTAGPYVTGNMQESELRQIIERQGRMESEASLTRSYWQDVYSYILPRKRHVISSLNPGQKVNTDLFDTTAVLSNHLLAGALHGMLTNPETRFFELLTGDPRLDSDMSVRRWLQEAADRIFHILHNSNFQTEIHEIYLDLGAIGTACLYMGEEEKNILHFEARAMKEIFIRENHRGLVDTVQRKFNWKLRQIVLEFGEKALPQELLKKYYDGNESDFPIIHATEPQKEKGKESVFPIQSIYLLVDQCHELSRGGFREMPFCVPRWTKTPGEVYGRGPGMDMLPDIKMLNKMMETTLKGAQKTVDPPLMVSDTGVIGTPRLTPGGLTVIRPMSDVPIKPLITDARIDFGIQLIDRVAAKIRQGFYVDQLQLPEGPQQTATEVNARTEQMLRLMGPVLGRQNFELLGVLIDRAVGVAERRNLLPERPQALKGRRIDVRYSSLVARAQRMSDGQNLARALAVLQPLIDLKQDTLDNLDADATFKYVAGDVYGVPQKLFRDERALKKIRDATAAAHAKAASEMSQEHQANMMGKVLPAVAQVQQATNQPQKAQ